MMKIIKWQNLILSLVAYEKLIHLIFTYKVVTWHCVHVSLLLYFFLPLSLVLFICLSLYLSPLRLNCFIVSLFLLMPLPHSLPMYLSQTSLAIYLYLLLNLSFTIRIAIILLLFFHISLSHSLSVSLAQPLTILHFIFATLFLSFLHSYYDMTIINIDLFCFNNNYYFACLVACLYED